MAKPAWQRHPTAAPSHELRSMSGAFLGREQREQGYVCTWVCVWVCTRAQQFEPSDQGGGLRLRDAQVFSEMLPEKAAPSSPAPPNTPALSRFKGPSLWAGGCWSGI